MQRGLSIKASECFCHPEIKEARQLAKHLSKINICKIKLGTTTPYPLGTGHVQHR